VAEEVKSSSYEMIEMGMTSLESQMKFTHFDWHVLSESTEI